MTAITCPRCGASGNESCTTTRGNDHAARVRAEIATLRPAADPEHHAERYSPDVLLEPSDPAPELHGEDVDDYSMCICGRPMDGHPEPTGQGESLA